MAVLNSTARGPLSSAECEKKSFSTEELNPQFPKKWELDRCCQYIIEFKAIEKFRGIKNGIKVSKKQYADI